MKIGVLVWILGVALLIGCGGGGGGGGGGSTGGGPSRIRIEALTTDGAPVDLANLTVGQTLRMRLVGFDSSNRPVEITGSGWEAPNGGSVLAVTSDGTLTTSSLGGPVTLTASGNGRPYTSIVNVRPNPATVIGIVRTVRDVRVEFALVEFYNAAGLQIGSLRTDAQGRFTARVPASATTFVVNMIDLLGFYNQFDYQSRSFTKAIGGCRARLPALNGNTTTRLPGDVILFPTRGGVPPPPPGCF